MDRGNSNFKIYEVKQENDDYIKKIVEENRILKENNLQLEEESYLLKKTIKELIDLDTGKTELFTNISHEVRTHLNIILAITQFLHTKGSREGMESNELKYINTLKQNCYRLLRILNNAIDLSKINSGFFELHEANYNIVYIVEEITLSVVQYAETKGIEVIFDTDIEECTILCDPDKIERVMMNLLSNAIKFTPEEGTIFVNIKNEKDYINISVKDNGEGIPKDKQQNIFGKFYQISKTKFRKNEGSGIGLYLTKSLVELHRGKIMFKSDCELGTEFVVTLPKVSDERKNINNFNDNQLQNKLEKINIEFSDI